MSALDPNSAIHRIQLRITDDVIDGNKHVNNVAYVKWMQDAAVSHSRACIGKGTLRIQGFTWVARSHHIEYLSPAFEGEVIEIRTWLTEIKRVRCFRTYEFVRLSDQRLIARGETDWVLINAESGRPASITDDVRSAFELLPKENGG